MSDRCEPGRPLRAHIHQEAFRHNIEQVSNRCPNANILVVLKADAYGHGLVQMAQASGDYDVAVASADEAKVLIDAGFSRPIWVLEGPFSSACMALSTRHPMVWVLHSLWQLALIPDAADVEHNIWIKLDTGMHRLGLGADQLSEALADLGSKKSVRLCGALSHFASSDEADHPFVQVQIDQFDAFLKAQDLTDLSQSLCNSGGVLFYPEAHRDWVRPGIILYGGVPDKGRRGSDHGMRAVMHLRSEVMALRQVPAGDTVGYGGRWQAQRDSVIATVACGYGDGYPRHAPDGTPVAINDQIVPLVGRVSMDLMTIDVTDLSGVKVGDDVELWGERVSVDDVAERSGTISYELLTGVTARVPRVYW